MADDRLFAPEAFEQIPGQMAMQAVAPTKPLRKHTVFMPCERHAPMFETETRYRRAETMCEGGYAGSPCRGGECWMRPGTDFYCAEFVAEHGDGCGIQGR